MTKFTLLAAASVAALAFAGAASATDITSAKVSNIGLTTTGTKTVYTIASETDGAAANRATTTTATHNTIASVISAATPATVFAPNASGTNYAATLTLTGATFQSPVTAAAITGAGAGCTITPATVVSGGGVGQNTVTVVFNVPTSCSATVPANLAPNGVTFDTPFVVDAGASSVSASVGYTLATTGAAFGGAAGTAQLVQKSAGYAVSVSAAPQTASSVLPTSLALGTPAYVSLVANSSSADNIVGSVSANVATPNASTTGAIYANAAAAALPAITYTLKVDGDFAVIKPGAAATDTAALAGTAGAPALTVNAGNTSAVSAAAQAAGAATIFVSIPAGNTTAVPSTKTFSATVTPALATNTLVTTPLAVTHDLETIGLQGTNFIAPWVGGSQAATKSVIRLSNSSGVASGPVSIRLNNGLARAAGVTTGPGSPVASVTCSTSFTIPATGDLQIGQGELNACFGDFLRGDLQITVQSAATSLTAKMRQVQTDGTQFETTLGRFSGANSAAAAF